MFALTSRNQSTILATLKQTADVGIDFSKNCKIPNDTDTFVNGIIFSGGGDKGTYLRAFLKKHQLSYSHITMLDDKRRHLEEIESALESLGIKFSGYRYGFLDDHVAKFDGKSANEQLALLTPHLPPLALEAVRHLKLTLDGEASPISTSTFAHGFFIPMSNTTHAGASAGLTMGNDFKG